MCFCAVTQELPTFPVLQETWVTESALQRYRKSCRGPQLRPGARSRLSTALTSASPHCRSLPPLPAELPTQPPRGHHFPGAATARLVSTCLPRGCSCCQCG